ncbi:MAG: double-strand break repair protein AddB [Azospirillaceae bacterium]
MTDGVSDRPNLFTIQAGHPFLDALAQGLMAETDGDPLSLARVTVLLPTRRACRSLREAFLRVTGGRGLLLPAMRPIGDVVEEAGLAGGEGEAALTGPPDLPPSIEGLERQMQLARLVLARGDLDLTPAQAFRMAADLARLIDEVATEGLDYGGLAGIVADSLAEHWQATLHFLEIVTRVWPQFLGEERLDPARRRDLLLRWQAAQWRQRPPAHPVIAAGSTGSIPATRELLSVVATLPNGRVVLPGLDRGMDQESWERLDESHPQTGMKRLLDALDRPRETVADWPLPHAVPRPRDVLLREIMRPAAQTEHWRAITGLAQAEVEGLRRIEAESDRQEAEAIALAMREVLETPERTAMLVTPDRRLARRVAAALGRWQIEIDDSAGAALANTAVGAFLRHLARAAEPGAGPVPLLTLLKHPLAAGGCDPARFRERVRDLERAILRGVRPGPGLAGLRAALATKPAEDLPADIDREALLGWWDGLAARLAPLFEAMAGTASFGALLEAHARAAEALADTHREPGPARLWRHDDGEAAASLIAGAAEAAGPLDAAVGPADFAALLDALLDTVSVRPRYGRHPRLQILGPLEARMQSADRVILAGLNEDVWPADPGIDPWMSRPMRQAFGLPPPERRIGLAAHDVVQLMAAPEVILSRARRVDGTPTVPSRWWLRLGAVLDAAGIALPVDRTLAGRAAGIDRWAGPVQPCAQPRPCPPPDRRPRRISATRVARWFANPYAIFAEQILRLRPLDPIDLAPGAAEKGMLIHDVLADFLADSIEVGQLAPRDRLIELGRRRFAEDLGAYPALTAFWWPRFTVIADWFVARQAARGEARPMALEARGLLDFAGPGGPFRLTARIDRMDRLADGSAEIIDYKTGGVPSRRQVAYGHAPQLPLEALIAEAGGYQDVAPATVSRLAYWRLTGDGEGGTVVDIVDPAKGPDAAALIAEARAGMTAQIERFDRPETPYAANIAEDLDTGAVYAHLARVLEWSAGAGEAE